MAIPTTRAEFKDYCLRKLGAPVLEINVDDDQVEDRIDEALLYFADYHFDGTEKMYYKYQITEDDITNRYITLPDNMIGVVQLFPISDAIQTNSMFNVRYQFLLNDIWALNSMQLAPYYMARENLAEIEQWLVGKQPLRFNRHIGRCYIDMSWDMMTAGEYLIIECYQVVDPTTYPKVWGDRWLARYASCLIKQQWGGNLIKFEGMALPGGVKFNGKKIYDDATLERQALEKEMIQSYSLPATDMIG